MYRFVLFDLDGTLTDSREGIFNSVRYSLDKLGRPCPPYETLLRFVGPPLHDSFERYCGMDAQESHRAVNVFRERYETIGWAENKAAPGMVELMRCLKEQGRTLAVASSKPERSVVPIVEKFGFQPYLDAACGSDGKSEAKTDVIRKAFARLGIDGERQKQTVMVGDRKFCSAGRTGSILCCGRMRNGRGIEGSIAAGNGLKRRKNHGYSGDSENSGSYVAAA